MTVSVGRNPIGGGRNHGDDPQPTRVSPSFLTSYKLTRSLQFPHSVLKAHEHAVTVSRLILQLYSPEIILGSAALLIVLALAASLVLGKRPDPRMIFLCRLMERWPR